MKRNAELLKLEANTGKCVLEFALFSAVYAFDKVSSDNEVVLNENKIKEKYSNWLSEVGMLSGLSVDISVETISSETLEIIYYEGEDEAIDSSTRHQFLTVLVTFELNT
ncbi:MAG: hypothetical protein AB8D52_07295 [Gammaproteobacteria bacterium]